MKHLLKQNFIRDYQNIVYPKVISVAVELPSGAIETITNYHSTNEKCNYYIEQYNDNFELKHNPNVKIVGYMMI